MSAFPTYPRLFAAGTAYVRKGSGEPLLFVHGVGMRAGAWAPQIEHFSKRFDAIAIDLLGHGESAAPPLDASLGDYVRQVAALADTLRLGPANVVGHSLGGLIALGFAVAHPDRCLRLAVLNSVYCRALEARRAVAARAEEIATSGSAGDIDVPLRRWFGEGPGIEQTAAYRQVYRWLKDVDPTGYAAAYRVFAVSDEEHRGKLGRLSMPSLFATGSLDPNSTPDMSRAMAAEAPLGKAVVIEGARHMMNLVNPDETNAMLDRFFARPAAGS